MIDRCPACDGKLSDTADAHCGSAYCVWLVCTSCKTRIAPDSENYFGASDGVLFWGDSEGYVSGTS